VENITLLIVKIYLLGCALVALHSIYLWVQMTGWKKQGLNDIIDSHTGMKPWLISRVIRWPYILFCKTNPIELFSQLFFSRYGDEGHIYFGSRGLKNFLNDIFRGVNRYKKYRVNSAVIHLDPECLHKLKENYPSKFLPKYSQVIIAKYKKTYLFKSVFTSNNTFDISTSRFELDDCQRLTKEEIITSLNQLNLNVSITLIERIEKFSILK